VDRVAIANAYDEARRQADEDVIRRIVREEIAVITCKAYGRASGSSDEVRRALYLLADVADDRWSPGYASLTTEKVNL
jgi:hypothetical protein